MKDIEALHRKYALYKEAMIKSGMAPLGLSEWLETQEQDNG